MPIPESEAPEAFKAFEHERWQAAARVYHDAFSSLTSQVAEPLLDAAGVGRGTRSLDIASGPGHVAGRAAARGAVVTGCDFSEPMVTLARQLHPGATFQLGDAEALPFADESFDAVTMSFLLGHLARPARAIHEAARVLVPGGRLALSWWMPPERTAALSSVRPIRRRLFHRLATSALAPLIEDPPAPRPEIPCVRCGGGERSRRPGIAHLAAWPESPSSLGGHRVRC
jgi:SAM-dependent methyltransferase